jgi:hypothetical protein
VLEERVGVGRVLRVERDADRRADMEARVGDLEGLVQRGGDALAGGLRSTARIRVVAGAEQEQELVAALARQHVAGAREIRDAVRGLGEHRVAGLVAERVVDELEVVEVEVQERQRAAGAPCVGEVAPDLLLQERPVREAGEAVVVDEEGGLRIGALALGDVLARAQDRGDAPLRSWSTALRQAIVRVSPPRVSTSASRLEPAGATPDTRRMNASRASRRSAAGTAVPNQSRPSSSPSSKPSSSQPWRLMSSTRPASSRTTTSVPATFR